MMNSDKTPYYSQPAGQLRAIRGYNGKYVVAPNNKIYHKSYILAGVDGGVEDVYTLLFTQNYAGKEGIRLLNNKGQSKVFSFEEIMEKML